MSENKHELIIIGLTILLVGAAILYAVFDSPSLTAKEVVTEETVTSSYYRKTTRDDDEEDEREETSSVTETEEKEETSETAETTTIVFPLNLNTASFEELTAVNGIGEDRANSIITYRENNNGFKSVEELKNIYGIGEKTYQQVSSCFTVE